MPELSEEEVAQMRATAARATELEAEKTRLEGEREQIKAQAQADAVRQRDAQWQQHLAQQQQAAAQQAAQQGAKSEDIEAGVVLEPDQFRRVVSQEIAKFAQPIVQAYVQDRQQGLETTRSTLRTQVARDEKLGPVYNRYRDEIEGALQSLSPEQAATPRAYELAIQAVQMQHLDEIVEERVAARTAPAPDENAEEWEDEREPTGRVGAPMPAPSSARPTPARDVQPRRRKFEPLSREEKHYADVLGVDEEQYDRYSRSDLSADIFGFKDPKTGKIRARV